MPQPRINLREATPKLEAWQGGFRLMLGEQDYRPVFLAQDGQTATLKNPGFWATANDALRAWSN